MCSSLDVIEHSSRWNYKKQSSFIYPNRWKTPHVTRRIGWSLSLRCGQEWHPICLSLSDTAQITRQRLSTPTQFQFGIYRCFRWNPIFCEISNFPRIYSTIFFFEIIDIRTFKCCRTECQHENGGFSSCVEGQCCHSLCGTRLSNSWNKVIIQFSSCVAQMYKCTYIYIRDKLSQCLCMYQEKLWEVSISLMSVMNNCAQPSKSFLADRSNDFNDYQNTHTHNSIITYVLYQHTSKRWQDFK